MNEKDLISSLPLDLKLHILGKLPLKSIAKLISVSKLWSSIVRGKSLTETFLSRSLTRPSFLFTFRTQNFRRFHSRSSSGNCRTSSITIPNPMYCLSSPIRGLICGEDTSSSFSKVICNPSTGQFVTLPILKTRRTHPSVIKHFLGYDPVNDVYKVLCMIIYAPPQARLSEEYQVFTLGAKKKAWRMIQCNHPHYPLTKELCRDGVVYYGAWHTSPNEESVIVSFDVKSEDFGVIKLPEGVQFGSSCIELVNIHGNIALASGDLWVLQDAKKQEWSKLSFLLPDIVSTWSYFLYCKGTISTGEIIFAPFSLANPYFLVYYDLKRNNARRVDVEGVRDGGNDGSITAFLDHVESPMFLDKQV